MSSHIEQRIATQQPENSFQDFARKDYFTY